MRFFFAAVFLALVGLALPSTSSGRESSEYRIAYVAPVAWGVVCVADASTTARVCLTEPQEGADIRGLAWSPDGTMIAFQQEMFNNGENVGGQLVVVAADGGRRLPDGRPSPSVLSGHERVRGMPMWSSDSKEVAIFGDEGILITRIANGVRRSVSFGALGGLLGLPADVAWSPDNKHFAIGALDAGGRPALLLLDAKDGSAKTLVEFTGNDIGPGMVEDISWSPDGSQILFTRTPPPPSAPWGGTPSQHWVVNADGTNAKMLYDSGSDVGSVMEARFSPSGRTIAFDGMSGDVVNIFLMQSDGSNIRQLTHSATGAFGPRWWPGADTQLLYWDMQTVTMRIITSDTANLEDGEARTLFFGMDYEWAPVAGPLPRGLSTPEPTSTMTPAPTAAPTAIPSSTPPQPTPTPATTAIAGPGTGEGMPESNSPPMEWSWALGLLGVLAVSAGAITSFRWRAQRR